MRARMQTVVLLVVGWAASALAQFNLDAARAFSNPGIEMHRKGALTLIVTLEGQKAAGAQVKLEQQTHDYRFGVGVDRKQNGNGRYWDIVRKYYNYTVETNALKWRHWEYSLGMKQYNKAAGYGLPMRGHTIFWGRDNMDQVSGSGSALKDKMKKRVQDAVGGFKGKITEWDFNNEIINNHGGLADKYSKEFGDGIIHDMFTWTHAIDPNIRMYFNEFGCEGEKDKAKHYYALVKKFLDRGLPKDKIGVGLQAHMSDDPRKGENLSLPYLVQCLNTMAPLGLPLLATEFDYDNPNDGRRADGLELFYRVWFAHPATIGVIQWGFWDGQNWKPESALWKGSSFNETEVARRYKKLVWEEWWTREQKAADSEGQIATKVFYGKHKVTVTHGGKTATFTLTWPKGGQPRLDKSESSGISVSLKSGINPVSVHYQDGLPNVGRQQWELRFGPGSATEGMLPTSDMPILRAVDIKGRLLLVN